jgi:bilirubin oxidase
MLSHSLGAVALLSWALKPSLALPQLPFDIPEEEAAALESIVEDEPDLSVFVVQPNLSPDFPAMFGVDLPIPPQKQPHLTVTNPVTGGDIWYYEIVIQEFSQQIYPNLGPATLVGYDGISPGPTIIVPRGVEAVVRFVNTAEVENSVHLHGSFSRAPFDGWAEDTTQPGEYKDYYYPNQQPSRTLWYHDHAMGITAENAYMGQAGVYIIHDPAEDALNLPSGYGEFDIPLVLTAKRYNEDGSLFSTNGELISLWGDVLQVNGQPWPKLEVEPRKYRFRFLNAAVSRSFALYFESLTSGTSNLPFQVISSDSGLLEGPVETTQLYVSMAERYDIVFDFSDYADQTIELRNEETAGGIGVEVDYEDTDKVMRFVVASAVSSPDTSVVPDQLRDVPFPPAGSAVDHSFRFARTNGDWTINGVGFTDVENRLLANVPFETVQIWQLENRSQGWTHPIHVHLVDFRILSRTGGRGIVEPYESAGLKDVVWLGKGETVLVEAHYAPWPGVYMFHCHNLIHEDHDMMAAFNVTLLPDLGYTETQFMDPMEEEWRPKPFVLDDFSTRSGEFSDTDITDRIIELANADPYSPIEPEEPEE